MKYLFKTINAYGLGFNIEKLRINKDKSRKIEKNNVYRKRANPS